MSAGKSYVIESLDTGLRLMSLFLAHDTLSVTDAARELSLCFYLARSVFESGEFDRSSAEPGAVT
ncbi:hypothetical protein AB0929_40360 [Streptomyces massasporeus]|uniref:hypothetical protein n=1 Tax=Streptomyces massasporeus TaxID=67324 RepID=UPI003454DE60